MRKIRDDLTGQKFGKLTVIEQAEDYVVPSGQHFTRWKCRCECGNISYPITSSLKSGKTQSCGCLGLEKRTSARKRYNEYYIIDNYVVFNTYNGESFLIDYEDLDKVKEHCWCNDGHGYFKDGSYCNDVKDTISTNNPRAVGVGTILDMCICIGQELIERVAHGTFDKNEHGQWLKRMSTPDSLKCSICGNNHEYETTYCPHCGRKMDSDVERRCEK